MGGDEEGEARWVEMGRKRGEGGRSISEWMHYKWITE